MESCSCVHCQADTYHIEQMQAEEAASKDDYMENKPPSIYEKLEELNQRTMSPTQNELMRDIMDAVNAVDNELIALALELPTEQAERLLAIQERLY
ncbi:hypothetical protein [Bacillus paranthracis]|uniref:hypothetical protein n=1 Tax=Bacillus paranthracis TaxID=2026186 RepID=UPI0013D652C8|nr:hypothetical protein [Bacillus paranthracis]